MRDLHVHLSCRGLHVHSSKLGVFSKDELLFIHRDTHAKVAIIICSAVHWQNGLLHWSQFFSFSGEATNGFGLSFRTWLRGLSVFSVPKTYAWYNYCPMLKNLFVANGNEQFRLSLFVIACVRYIKILTTMTKRLKDI